MSHTFHSKIKMFPNTVKNTTRADYDKDTFLLKRDDGTNQDSFQFMKAMNHVSVPDISFPIEQTITDTNGIEWTFHKVTPGLTRSIEMEGGQEERIVHDDGQGNIYLWARFIF